MHDMRDALDPVVQAARRLPSPNESRTVMFIAATDRAGTSSAAASFAVRAEAGAGRAVWLIDLDLASDTLHTAFQMSPWSAAGPLSRAYDASLGKAPIYTVSPDRPSRPGGNGMAKLLSVHQVGGSRLLVSRFRRERLAPDQRFQFRDSPAWWSALRTSADWIVVDAPSISRSGAGLSVARHMDGVVLVLAANFTPADDAVTLRKAVEARGGTVIGAILNRT